MLRGHREPFGMARRHFHEQVLHDRVAIVEIGDEESDAIRVAPLAIHLEPFRPRDLPEGIHQSIGERQIHRDECADGQLLVERDRDAATRVSR